MLYVESYRNKDNISDLAIVIDTTSKSDNWSKGLSPFFVEGGHLYDKYYAKNAENAWQGSKVYAPHDNNGTPTSDYFLWAQRIWNDTWAHRYPMGKGVKPLYSWWDGQKLDYIEARKKIYIPIYARGVIKTKAFGKLLYLYRTTKKDIYLVDFDGYNHIAMGKSMTEVLNDPNMRMGHAFVLYSLLEKYKEGNKK
jgi:hypothetical protein